MQRFADAEMFLRWLDVVLGGRVAGVREEEAEEKGPMEARDGLWGPVKGTSRRHCFFLGLSLNIYYLENND